MAERNLAKSDQLPRESLEKDGKALTNVARKAFLYDMRGEEAGTQETARWFD